MTLPAKAVFASLFTLLSLGTHAQTPPARPAAADPTKTAPDATPPSAEQSAPYQDRIIEGLPPAAQDDGGINKRYDATGWPRLLRFETRLGNQTLDIERRTRLAFCNLRSDRHAQPRRDLSDGSLTPEDKTGSLTVRQRGLPMEGGWEGNHEAGVISSPNAGLTRQQLPASTSPTPPCSVPAVSGTNKPKASA
ncbi:MAG: hypothetical protein R3E42_02550 [Burkholderiaceae bacterium]